MSPPAAGPPPPPGWRACTSESLRCEYWTWGPGYLRPDCCTRALQALLSFTEALLSRHHLAHWLDYGALLGAVRGGAHRPLAMSRQYHPALGSCRQRAQCAPQRATCAQASPRSCGRPSRGLAALKAEYPEKPTKKPKK